MIDLKPHRRLANAIILQAMTDYRKALEGEKVNGRDPSIVIGECEHFFRSEWFMLLTNVDGNVIIEKIQNMSPEVRTNIKKIKSYTLDVDKQSH